MGNSVLKTVVFKGLGLYYFNFLLLLTNLLKFQSQAKMFKTDQWSIVLFFNQTAQ